MSMRIECVLECGNHLGEGPVWDVEDGCLYWVDGTGRIGVVERPIPNKAIGKKLAKLNVPGRFWLTAVTRFGKAQIVTSDLVGQEGDVLVFVSDMDCLDALQAHIEAGGD